MNAVRGDTLNRVASVVGENPIGTETVLGAALPALISGLTSKASTPSGANDLLELIRRHKLDSRQYADATGALATPDAITGLSHVGGPLLDFVLGGRTNAVTHWITSFAGVNRSSVTSLLAIALPLVIGQITRALGTTGLNASSLQSLLGEQRTFLQNAPSGLAAALGATELGRAAVVETHDRGRVTPQSPVVDTYASAPATGYSWWKWAIPLLLLALIPLWFMLRRQPAEVAIRAGSLAPAIASLGELVERKLPRGITLRLPSLGVESKLLGYIEDPRVSVDTETWFSFDRLEFETDSAALKPSSREQLQNIADILRAYPDVRVKIGGYTDNVGDEVYNLKLSADRANNTINEIANLGIERSRLEAEGYGENHPIADNATPEGRQRNRRIDIRVTKK
jgi:outer membrane protein OmpA-like peptidoglycan-associated protein